MELEREEIQTITNDSYIKVTLVRNDVHSGYLYLRLDDMVVLGEYNGLDWNSFTKLYKRFKKEVNKFQRESELSFLGNFDDKRGD